MMETSSYALAILKEIEGWSATAYPDAGGHSIGYGTLLDTVALRDTYLDATIDRDTGEMLLFQKLRPKEALIRGRIHVPLNQNQFDALSLLTYNVESAIVGGTLDDLINAGASEEAIRAKWLAYHYSQGRPLQVLKDRRQREVDLYFTPVGVLSEGSKKKS